MSHAHDKQAHRIRGYRGCQTPTYDISKKAAKVDRKVEGEKAEGKMDTLSEISLRTLFYNFI